MTHLLDINDIRPFIDPHCFEQIKQFEIKEKISSTNDHLLQLASVGFNDIAICLAEQQSKGRGRLGRKWVSPFGANIYLSLLWPFKKNANDLAGLSLAVGTMIADALENISVPNIQLKWPNDILYQHKKLGGVLIEIAPLQNKTVPVVIGIGLNVNMPDDEGNHIDQAWVDLNHIVGRMVDRNLVVGQLITVLMKQLPQFEKHGFNTFSKRWNDRDILFNQLIDLKLNSQVIRGVARGVDMSGRLLIENQLKQIIPISFGEVTFLKRL